MPLADLDEEEILEGARLVLLTAVEDLDDTITCVEVARLLVSLDEAATVGTIDPLLVEVGEDLEEVIN